MPKDAPVNTGASLELPIGPRQRVSEMQAKLHRWAVADPGRRFDDLFNFVYDPATLLVAFDRVAGNTGSRTPGVDGLTVADVEERVGMLGFLDDLRAQLKQGAFRPLPVRERKIPKPGGSGKLRKLGIPTVADRVVQAALKLVLEPIFEADFVPVSYGFRPMRRAQDAIAEIHQYGTQGYRWVLDADIEACFDSIDHAALMDRMCRRVKDKRVLGLVKAFLKAGVLIEVGDREDTHTGTPQGGILSPLLANIALSALDEHLHKPWEPGGTMSTAYLRSRRRVHGLPRWRIVGYADDFVILVHGERAHAEDLREDVATVLKPLGLRLSEAKTQVVHMSDGFDFLGFHIRWKRKRGTSKWHVYTFIADRPIRSVKAKIRALTRRTSQQDPASVLIRLNQIMRGWANYFKHAACKRTLSRLSHFVWWRVIGWLRRLHRWRWKDVHRRFTTPSGQWTPITVDGIALFNLAAVSVTRYRYRGNTIPNPWTLHNHARTARNRGEPGAVKAARRVRRAAWGNGPRAIPAPRPRPTQPEKALVLCVDEKTQVQALDRSAPVLPMMPGTPERVTHDYIRAGTLDLFAALVVAGPTAGQVITQIHSQHRAIEFRKFLITIDKTVPADLDVHLICDNLATHTTPTTKKWLLAHPRFHIHFTPTASSWLNLVERWFAEITVKLIRRGVHHSVKQLAADITAWVDNWNANPKPYVWTKTADQILESLAAYCQRINASRH